MGPASFSNRQGIRKESFARHLALWIAALALQVLSFPVYDLWPLGYVCLVPWLFLLSDCALGRAALYSWLLGLAFFGIEVSWLRFVTIPGWVSLTIFLSLYYLAFGTIIQALRSRWPIGFLIITPVCWVALEYVRSFVLGGFSWFYLGHTQYLILPAIQIADVAGVYAVSFMLALINGALADSGLLFFSGHAPEGRRARVATRRVRIAAALGVGATLVLGVWAYGVYRLWEYAPTTGPKICTVQGSIPQYIKDNPASSRDVLGAYLRISEEAVGQGAAMIVWPETMVPGFLNLAAEERWRVSQPEVNELANHSYAALTGLAQRAKARLLVGGQSVEVAGKLTEGADLIRFNSAYYMDARKPEDKPAFLGRYDKIEIVPFGEYTPLKRYFPFLARMVPYEVGFEAGREARILDLEGARFGVLICYEDTIPRLVRRFRQAGAQFLVNISNDGWFEGSTELDDHLAVCVFRAVENRVGIVRSVNTGISAFISPTGKVEGVVSRQGRRKNVEGTLTRSVLLDRRDPRYPRWGDWLGQGCLVIMVGLLIARILVVMLGPLIARIWSKRRPSAPESPAR